MNSAILFLMLLFLLPAGAKAQDFAFDEELYDEDYFHEFDDEMSLTIVGTRQTSQQIIFIEREDIEESGAQDLANLLQETLNLNIVRYGTYGNQTSIHLRGYSSRRIAFLVDGIPANSSLDGRFDVNQIDLNSIERIEVIYGGSDTKFNVSGAMGGVINIITLRRQEPGWRFSGTVSNTSTLPGEYRDQEGERQGPHWEDLFNAQNLAFSAAYGNSAAYRSSEFSFRGGLFTNRAANRFIYKDNYNYHRRRDNNEVWDAGLNASFVWEMDNLSKLIASTNIYYGDRNIPISGFSSIFGMQEDLSSRQTLMFDMPRAFHDNFATEVSLSWNFARRDYTSPADIFSRHDQNSISLINRWAWYPGRQLSLRSGYDYRYIDLISTEMGNRKRHDGGIYLTAEYRPARLFEISPSVKAVFSSSDSVNMAFIPRLGLLWNISDSVALKNNYFRSFKFPDFEELYWAGGGMNGDSGGLAIGNPNLRPEDGWGGDLGVTWTVNRFIELESVFFVQWMRDSIHWFSDSGLWQPENVGEAFFFGLDERIIFNIPVSIGPIKQISPSFTYKYLRSYLLSFGYDFASDRRIPYNPELTIGAAVDISWIARSTHNGTLIISAHYESARYHDRANITRLEPYLLLNATLNQQINSNSTVIASLKNILNRSYESFYAYPMPGINLTVGIRVQF